MSIQLITDEANDYIKRYPHLEDEIREHACLAVEEIYDGGSPHHEYELFHDEMLALVERQP